MAADDSGSERKSTESSPLHHHSANVLNLMLLQPFTRSLLVHYALHCSLAVLRCSSSTQLCAGGVDIFGKSAVRLTNH